MPALIWSMVLPASGVRAVVTATGTLLSGKLLPSPPKAPYPQAVLQARRIQRARGQVAGADLDDGPAIHRRSGRGHRHRHVAARRRVVPQLAVVVVSPAVHQARESSAHAYESPALTAAMVLPSMGVPAVATATGTRLCPVELFPSSPSALSPQQYTRPDESTTHTEYSPALIWSMVLPAIGVPAVATATGTLLPVVELLPSWPWPPYPQQYTSPAELSAQVKFIPALIWVRVTPDRTPPVYTATGTLLCVVELFPSSPSLSSPQQDAKPLTISHVWVYPVEIVAAGGAVTVAACRETGRVRAGRSTIPMSEPSSRSRAAPARPRGAPARAAASGSWPVPRPSRRRPQARSVPAPLPGHPTTPRAPAPRTGRRLPAGGACPPRRLQVMFLAGTCAVPASSPRWPHKSPLGSNPRFTKPRHPSRTAGTIMACIITLSVHAGTLSNWCRIGDEKSSRPES